MSAECVDIYSKYGHVVERIYRVTPVRFQVRNLAYGTTEERERPAREEKKRKGYTALAALHYCAYHERGCLAAAICREYEQR